MAIKLVVLKSGEDVIADVREMLVGDEDTPKEKQKVIGYYFIKPCGVTLNNKAINVNDSADGSYELKLFPWCPLAKNDAIPISTDWVVTLVDPVDKLKEMYETQVLDKFKEVLKTKQEEEEKNASESSDTNKPQKISVSDR
tara:strand:+ start:822 stop:1244 length:423 start_codon:yes stop_codon:yes gene_type:complete